MTEVQATILVIEDEETLRESMADYLEDRDFRVITAVNGRLGIEAFEQEQPDLVLTDLSMPEVDGLEVLRRIGKASKETPLIVVSGTGHIGDSIQALRLGAWDYILKPVEDMSIILHAVEKARERARLLRENRRYQEHLELVVRERTADLEGANRRLALINTRLRKVVDTTRKLASCSEMSYFGMTLLQEFVNHMSASGGSLYLVEEAGVRLLNALHADAMPPFLAFPLPEKSLFRAGMEAKRALRMADIAQENNLFVSGYDAGALLLFPFQDEQGSIIALLLLHSDKPPFFTDLDKEVGAILASNSVETLRAIRATELMRNSEKKHRTLFESSRDAIFLLSQDKQYLDANPAALDLFGIDSLESLRMLTPLSLSPEYQPDGNLSAEKGKKLLAAVLREGAQSFEWAHCRTDASPFPASVLMTRIELNGETLFLTTVRDITEEKQVEEARSQALAFTQTVIDGFPEALMVINRDHSLALANRTAMKILGDLAAPSSEVICYHMTHGGEQLCQRSENKCPLQQVIKTKTSVLFEHVYTDPQGQEIPVEIVAAPIFDEAGEVLQVIESARDVSGRKELEAQLRQAQKMEAVGQLAGGVAHDFNNLLQAILGYGEMALYDAKGQELLHDEIEQMMQAGERAKILVSQLLAFSRRQVLKMKNTDINEVVADLMKMIRRVIGEHISLDFIPGYDLGQVYADRGQIEQILMNLCVNARDAMPSGGGISIETQGLCIDAAFCRRNSWAEAGDYVLLRVKDTGCGMDASILENIFEPFFTTKAVGEGTGLGLSTVYGLVKQHQGLLHVESIVNEGSAFEIYLPLSKTDHPVTEREQSDRAPGGTERILLAEDDAMVCNLTKTILSKAGYQVLTASDGQEALEIFNAQSKQIDLILLDVMMPKIGGRVVLDRIRDQGCTTRVLFTSGYSMDAIHTDFILDDGLELIQKPFKRDVLLRTVRAILDAPTQ